jgi:hypothetical protein
MSYLYNKKDFKKIILKTEDAVASDTFRNYSFTKFNTISIKKPSYLKIDAVTTNFNNDDVWTIKLDKVNYNKASYYNSDLNGLPTILTKSFNGKSTTILDNVALELTQQDISEIVLRITKQDGNGLGSAKMIIEISIEEIPDDIFSGR